MFNLTKKIAFLFSIFATQLFAKISCEINAKNAILINADSGAVLFEKNGYEKAYPASVTKISTTIFILENYSNKLDDSFIASETALRKINSDLKKTSKYPPYILENDGSSFDIVLSENLKLWDRLHGVMVCTGNDAANMAAEALSGNINTFMKDLNRFLQNIGCLSTNFLNPHGLHVEEHMTTTYDLALMTRYALNNPDFVKLFSCKYFLRPQTNKKQKKELITYNKLLKPGKYYYPHIIGSKTGYHSKAKYTLVSSAKKNDRTLILALMGSSSSEQRYEDTIKLLELAFSETQVTKKLIDKDKIFLAEFEGAAKNVKAKLNNDLEFSYYPSEETPTTVSLVFEDIRAPIKKGQKVGKILIKDQNDRVLKKEILYSSENVRKRLFYALKKLFI